MASRFDQHLKNLIFPEKPGFSDRKNWVFQEIQKKTGFSAEIEVSRKNQVYLTEIMKDLSLENTKSITFLFVSQFGANFAIKSSLQYINVVL